MDRFGSKATNKIADYFHHFLNDNDPEVPSSMSKGRELISIGRNDQADSAEDIEGKWRLVAMLCNMTPSNQEVGLCRRRKSDTLIFDITTV